MDNNKLVEVSPVFKDIAKREGFLSEELLNELADTGSVHAWTQYLRNGRMLLLPHTR